MVKITQALNNNQKTALHQAGGTITELLSPFTEDTYSVMTGSLPHGAIVPLHSHHDTESFYVVSGQPEGLVQTVGGLQWQTLKPGDFMHISGDSKHAWRNLSSEIAFMIVICTAKLGRAREEMGQLTSEYGAQFRSLAALQRLADIAERYGYWLGSREENAAVGIELPMPTLDEEWWDISHGHRRDGGAQTGGDDLMNTVDRYAATENPPFLAG